MEDGNDPNNPNPNGPPPRQGEGGKAGGSQGGDGEHMIPKARFDEINEKLKATNEALAKIEADRKKESDDQLRKKGEFEKLYATAEERAKKLEADYKTEKEIADKYRARREAKLTELKKAAGEKWIQEYEGFSLESLEKLEGQLAGSPKPGVGGGRPTPGGPATKPIATMTSKEFEQYLADVKAGRAQIQTQ